MAEPSDEPTDALERQRAAALQTAASILAQQRRAEQELRSAKRALEERTEELAAVVERFSLVLDSTPNAVLMLSRAGRITLANKQAELLFGYPREELIGELVERLVPERFRRAHPAHRDSFFADPKVRSMGAGRDLFGLRSDGTEVPIEIGLNPLVTRDGTFVLASIIDITGRKSIEAELIVAKERAESADKLKSAFLATMSHELRTPLNSIIGFTGIILKGLAGPLNGEQRKQLEMVRGSARHLLALISDVLDISKIEVGQLEVERELFELPTSIRSVIESVRPLVENKGLALQVRLAPELDMAISDQRRFEQILLNLLSNAAKFTERGHVALSAEIHRDYQVHGRGVPQPAVRLQVSDTGMGIKPADIPTLFQPFRQLESGLARNHEGTGLGLAICRRLADLMGGEIGVESEWGKGSTFSFTLPLGRT
ncbi:MAG TPA: ATP-binding protein [Polyangiales bacterium]|nr:ATP-binding protein [Polyangiales bacterium]